MDLNSTKELISEIKKGNMVLLMDDEDRENEGDLILAGEKVSPEKISAIFDAFIRIFVLSVLLRTFLIGFWYHLIHITAKP